MRLIVFDIDGTLLLNGSVVREAFENSFEATCGFAPSARPFSFAGMTDRGIFRRFLGEERANGRFDELFAPFACRFTAELQRIYADATGPHLLPGVEPLLAALHEDDEFALALGTGNIRESAYVKLARFGLDRFFPTGGFGGDHEERADVFRASLREARAHYGAPFLAAESWIVGDTGSDIEAARQIGARMLGVQTGFARPEELLHADVLLTDLSDTDQVLDLLSRGQP